MEDVATNSPPDEWNQIGFIISSKYRIAVFRQLVDGPSTPTSVAADADLPITHISRALRALTDRSLVELLVAKETRKGRLYGLTDRGTRLWQRIQTAGMVD